MRRQHAMNGKRMLSILLAAALCFSLAVGVFADEEDPLVICLDPGHGARDSGAVATYDGIEYQEADLVLRIALYLRAELETYENVKVFATEKSHGAITLQCADGEISLTELQLPGKKRMAAKALLNGLR